MYTTSDRFDTWLILSGMTGSRQYYESTMVWYINGAPSTPGYLLALLRELSQCPRALTEITKPKQVRKMRLTHFLYHFKKRVGKTILTFRT